MFKHSELMSYKLLSYLEKCQLEQSAILRLLQFHDMMGVMFSPEPNRLTVYIHQNMIMHRLLEDRNYPLDFIAKVRSSLGEQYVFPVEDYIKMLKFEVRKYFNEHIALINSHRLDLNSLEPEEREYEEKIISKWIEPLRQLKFKILSEHLLETSELVCTRDFMTGPNYDIFLWPAGRIVVDFDDGSISQELKAQISRALQRQFFYSNCPLEILSADKNFEKSLMFVLDDKLLDENISESISCVGFDKEAKVQYVKITSKSDITRVLHIFLHAIGIHCGKNVMLDKTKNLKTGARGHMMRFCDCENYQSDSQNPFNQFYKDEYGDLKGDENLIDYTYNKRGRICTSVYTREEFEQYYFEIPGFGKVCNYCGTEKYDCQIKDRSVGSIACMEGLKYNYDKYFRMKVKGNHLITN